MKLGEKQVLMMEKEVDFGVYLGTECRACPPPEKAGAKGAGARRSGGSISLQRIPATD